jgi:hypothetical protein
MTYEEPESMKEIRRIRERIYEQTKEMSPEEQIAYERSKVRELMKKYNLNLKTLSKIES